MRAGSLFAMASMFSTIYDYPSNDEKNPLRPQDINVTIKRVIPKGCKVYVIEGVEIVAINEQSAQKKYKKLKKD
jgi:hypothetical protein